MDPIQDTKDEDHEDASIFCLEWILHTDGMAWRWPPVQFPHQRSGDGPDFELLIRINSENLIYILVRYSLSSRLDEWFRKKGETNER